MALIRGPEQPSELRKTHFMIRENAYQLPNRVVSFSLTAEGELDEPVRITFVADGRPTP